jgi:hypothetical protein
MILHYVLFMLALANLIGIITLIYFKKHNWAISLSIAEIVMIYIALTSNL